MAINRYSRGANYAQFNPLTLQELSTLPLLKQGQHDQQMAMALAQKAQAAALLKDQQAADELIADVDKRIGDFTGDLMNRGVNRNSAKGLLELKQYRDNLMSPQGDLGKISANYAAYQQYATDLKKRYEKGELDRDTYEKSLALSMKEYGGYKSGSFGGFNASSRAKEDEIALDYLKYLKLSKNSVEGWRWVDNYQGSGEGVWEKNGVTTTSARPPAEVEAAIMARVMASDQVRQNIADDLRFMEGLNEYRPDENGMFTIDGVAYSAEDFYSDADLRRDYGLQTINNRIRSQIAPAVYASQTGQGSERTQDIKIPSSSSTSKGFNRNGIGLVEDLGVSLNHYSDLTSPKEYVNKVSELRKEGKFAEAERIQTELTRLTNEYVAQNPELKEKLNKITTNIKKDPKFKDINPEMLQSAIDNYMLNGSIQFGMDKGFYSMAEAYLGTMEQVTLPNGNMGFKTKFGTFSIPEIDALNSKMFRVQEELNTAGIDNTGLDKYLSYGVIQNSKSYKINTFDNNTRAALNSTIQNNIDAQNFNIPSVYDEDMKVQIINDIKTADDVIVTSLNTFGEFAKPTITISYKLDNGKYNTVDVELPSLRSGKIHNSVENIIDYLAIDDPDLNAEFKGQIAYFDTEIGQKVNFTNDDSYRSAYPNAIKKFSNISVLRQQDNSYIVSFKTGRGQNSVLDIPAQSKSEALMFINQELSRLESTLNTEQ